MSKLGCDLSICGKCKADSETCDNCNNNSNFIENDVKNDLFSLPLTIDISVTEATLKLELMDMIFQIHNHKYVDANSKPITDPSVITLEYLIASIKNKTISRMQGYCSDLEYTSYDKFPEQYKQIKEKFDLLYTTLVKNIDQLKLDGKLK